MSDADVEHAPKRSRCDDTCSELRITLGARQIYPPTGDWPTGHVTCKVLDRMRREAALEVLKLLDPEWPGIDKNEVPELRMCAGVRAGGVYIIVGVALEIHLQMQHYNASVVWKSKKWEIKVGFDTKVTWKQKMPSSEALYRIWNIAARVMLCDQKDDKILNDIDSEIKPWGNDTKSDARIFEETK